jgi:hypothetical protein
MAHAGTVPRPEAVGKRLMTLSRATIRRRGWIVPICVIVVVAAAVAVASSRASGYRAEAVLAVPTNGGPADRTATPPGTLATTYAALIPQDDGVAVAVARATGLSLEAVHQHISAVQVGATSVVDVTFADSIEHRAIAGATALVASIVGPNRTALSVPRGGLALARAPEAATVESRHVPGGPIPIGIVLGLCLGIAALIAWDRHDPRADDARTLEAELAVPVTRLDGRHANEAALRAVVERWRSLGEGQRPIVVALVAATPRVSAVTAKVAKRLESISAGECVFVCAGWPGGPYGGELVAIEADFVVLVALPGDRLIEIRRAMRSLEQLGAQPRWGVLADPSP